MVVKGNDKTGSRSALIICAPSPDQLATISVSTAKIINAMLQDNWKIDIIAWEDKMIQVDDTFVRLTAGATIFKIKSPFNKPSLWIFAAFRTTNKLIRAKSYNLLFSIAPYTWTPVLGFFLKKICKLPWVAFFADPWGNSPDLKLRFLRRILERWTLLAADAIVYSNHQLKSWALSQFPAQQKDFEKKAFVIPYFYNEELYPRYSNRGLDKKIVFRHLGQIPIGGYIISLLYALRMLFNEHPDIAGRIVFEFFGKISVRYKGEVERLLKSLKLQEQIIFYSDLSKIIHIPYSENLRLMKEADTLLLLGIHPSFFHGWGNTVLHIKLIDYLGANKPIFALAGKDSVTDELLGDRVSVCTSDGPKIIKEALQKFISRMPTPSEQIRKQFSKESVYPLWRGVFKRVMKNG